MKMTDTIIATTAQKCFEQLMSEQFEDINRFDARVIELVCIELHHLEFNERYEVYDCHHYGVIDRLNRKIPFIPPNVASLQRGAS